MSNLPTVVRSQVSQKSTYRDYHEDLRIDFWFSCAYCALTEIEALGIAFCVDHYEPQWARGDLKNDYNNLMYACDLCNGYKGGQTPEEALRRQGFFFFRPDLYHPDDHFALNNVRLNAKSSIGEYTIECLYLNRLQLRRLREIRERLYRSYAMTLEGFRALQGWSIDRLPREVRLKVLKLKQDLKEQSDNCQHNLNELLRRVAKSPLLDPDPQKPDMARERKEFLREKRALLPKF